MDYRNHIPIDIQHIFPFNQFIIFQKEDILSHSTKSTKPNTYPLLHHKKYIKSKKLYPDYKGHKTFKQFIQHQKDFISKFKQNNIVKPSHDIKIHITDSVTGKDDKIVSISNNYTLLSYCK